MSKLNDSTLKILKKYRLDTDMSVFGNENKLYDVVKVMDDMVGNQVSKYVANIDYRNSTMTENIKEIHLTNGITQPKTIEFNITLNDSDVNSYPVKALVFDKQTMKLIRSYKENSPVICVGYVSSYREHIGYIVVNFVNKTLGCYKDIHGHELISPNTNIKHIYINWYLIIGNASTGYIDCSNSNTVSALFGDYTSDYLGDTDLFTINKLAKSIITLPEIVGSYDECYISPNTENGVGASSNTSFPYKTLLQLKLTSKLNITEV